MYLSDRITAQLKAATTRKQCLEIILDECFSEDHQDAAMDWCDEHRQDLFLEED